MSEKKQYRRQLLRRLEDEKEKAEAVIRPRPYDQSVHYAGCGVRVLLIAFRQSWVPMLCWEIRDQADYSLFLAVGQSASSNFVVGDQQLDIDPNLLRAYLRRILSLNVPLATLDQPRLQCDGCDYEVHIGANYGSFARFSWPGGLAPEGWAKLETIVGEMVEVFQSLMPLIPVANDDASL